MSLDAMIVFCYFVMILIVSIAASRKHQADNAEDFMTGGHHLSWWQTGMTLIAMMFDPGIMGISALAFVWGFYVIQWNAVNIWITSWFAGMFIIGIYWRSGIITTPEYLEKRFNALARGFFSLIMTILMISLLAYAVYMGGILLNKFLGWPIWGNIIILSAIAGFYVIVGGIRTMLFMDTIQAVLLLVALIAVGITGFVMLGGLPGIRELQMMGEGGTLLKSLMPPLDFNLFSKTYYPLPAIPTFAVVAGLSWIICNFSMAQRLLAAKDESHSQKALIMAGVFNVFVMFLAYFAGVAMRNCMPELKPDEAFITLLLTQFPAGVKGLLIVGLIAALLSTIDGLIASSATLLTQDIYGRFIKKNASASHMKRVTKILQTLVVGSIFMIVPVFMAGSEAGSTPAYQIVQEFLGDLFGVLIAIYLLGIFFKRTTAKASFTAMILGMVVTYALKSLYWFGVFENPMNFAHRGTIQFIVVMLAGIGLSKLEKPKSDAELENLTIWTIPDIKGPWIGLKAWPDLWKWAIGLPTFWILLTICWELYMR